MIAGDEPNLHPIATARSTLGHIIGMTAIFIDQLDDMGYNDPIDNRIIPMLDGGLVRV
jgi:hypothetical protein